MAADDHGFAPQGVNEGAPVHVFFDGACPLCRREIGHYRRLRGADRLVWVDISRDQNRLASHGIGFQAAMERLHVVDGAGRLQTGAWAFAEIWDHLPVYRWLSAMLRRCGLLPLLDRGYGEFARWRLRRRCSDGACLVSPTAQVEQKTDRNHHPQRDNGDSGPHTRGEKSCA